MIRGTDLHHRANLRSLADCDFNNVKDDAVEVKKRTGTDLNVEPIVAEERGTDLHAIAGTP
jgi:hypothetical protein